VGVREEDTFSTKLENLLNKNGEETNSGITYDVMNCGVSGFGTREERLFYETFGQRYRPDVVLLTMVWNDDLSFQDEVRRNYVNRQRGKLRCSKPWPRSMRFVVGGLLVDPVVDPHPNEIAHAIAAQEIFHFLLKQKLLQ
jgi:hypothetical protein